MKKIVVIDDDVHGNQMICRILKNTGYEASSAFNGSEGLKMIMNERPDLVITDLYMPEKDGLETIMELRQMDKEIRILAISGVSAKINMTDILDTAEMFGADAVMAKPFQIESFLTRIKGLLDE